MPDEPVFVSSRLLDQFPLHQGHKKGDSYVEQFHLVFTSSRESEKSLLCKTPVDLLFAEMIWYTNVGGQQISKSRDLGAPSRGQHRKHSSMNRSLLLKSDILHLG